MDLRPAFLFIATVLVVGAIAIALVGIAAGIAIGYAVH